MSLIAFQQALVDLTLAPALARALRRGDVKPLAGYDLTVLERERLQEIVRQPGISVHCTLSRGNRFEVVAGAFPMTCVLLRPVLREVLDELWLAHRPDNYQLAGEQTKFAAFVGARIVAGALDIEYLDEVLAYEVACQDLLQRARLNPTKAEAHVAFRHDPDDLLPPLARLVLPPSGLPTGMFPARVTIHEGRFAVALLDVKGKWRLS